MMNKHFQKISMQIASSMSALSIMFVLSASITLISLSFTPFNEKAFAAKKASKFTLGEQAYDAFEEGKYLTAKELAEKAAEKGEANAFTLLGRIYAGGLGVPKDAKAAAKWYELGAKKDEVHSLVALGKQYAVGDGVKKNKLKAANFFERAAKKGEAQAQYNLALIYAKGEGRKQDVFAAAHWLKKAAENELVVAQYDLGTLYSLGRGVKKDLLKAAQWTGKAAQQGHSAAELEYAIMLFKGRGVKKDQQKAFQFFKSSASKGNPVAQNRLARLYAYGVATEPNPVEAAKWHMIARNAGISDMKMDLFIAKLPKDMKAKAQAELDALQGTNGLY